MRKRGMEMILLVGESGCGKSSIERYLVEHYGFEKVVTCTTRPKRDGEVDGVDYHFLSDEEFDKGVADGVFVEHAEYRGWKYGTLRQDCIGDKKILVVTPHGLRTMKRESGVDLISFYISVDRRSRLMKLLQRGDDIEEAYRRSLSDVGQFDGIADEVDFVLRNERYRHEIDVLANTIDILINKAMMYRGIIDHGKAVLKGDPFEDDLK